MLNPPYTRRDFIVSQVATLGLLGTSIGCEEKRAELPTLTPVPAFKLTDQRGQPLSAESLRGKTWVAAFMFTRCPSICPRITKTMVELQKKAKSQDLAVHWVSFSVDPDNDSPQVLTEYAAEHGCDLSNWSFLTGPVEKIRTTAEDGFKLAFEGSPTEGAEHLGISHGSHLVLVDPHLNIRGYYRTLDGDAQQRLLQDAKQLR